MPKCQKCYEVFPPQFCVPIETAQNPEIQQCVFCDREVNEIQLKGGTGKYTKKQCVKEYKVFLRQLKEKSNIAKLLTKGEVENGTGDPT